jgi:hypothetical protein
MFIRRQHLYLTVRENTPRRSQDDSAQPDLRPDQGAALTQVSIDRPATRSIVVPVL